LVLGLSPLVGNDLVAWAVGLNVGKANDRRFVARVFTAQERARIETAANPDLVLWTLWAAKESLFKIVRKTDPKAVFSPQRFEVLPAEGGLVGAVIWQELRAEWTVMISTEWLHVCAVLGPAGAELKRVSTSVGPVGRQESAGVRHLATALLAQTGFPGCEVRGRPPRVYQRRVPLAGDLSLSHDEGFGAVAWLPP